MHRTPGRRAASRGLRVLRVATAMLAWLLVSASAPHAAPTGNALVFADTQPLVVDLTAPTKPRAVVVRNTGGDPAQVTFCALFPDVSATNCASIDIIAGSDANAATIAPYAVKAMMLSLPPPGTSPGTSRSGYLVVAAQNGGWASDTRALRFTDLTPNAVTALLRGRSATLGASILWGSLAVALVVIVLRAVRLRRYRLSQEMHGMQRWTYSGSFATNCTAFGAVLGTAFAAQTLPNDTQLLSKGTYAAMNVLFGVLVILAPFIFNGVRPADAVNTDAAAGYVGTFLLATGVMLWAVLGEMTTLVVLVEEIGQQHTLFRSGVVFFQFMLGVIALALLVYIWYTVRAQITVQTQPPAQPDAATDALPHAARTAVAIIPSL